MYEKWNENRCLDDPQQLGAKEDPSASVFGFEPNWSQQMQTTAGPYYGQISDFSYDQQTIQQPPRIICDTKNIEKISCSSTLTSPVDTYRDLVVVYPPTEFPRKIKSSKVIVNDL